MESAGSNRVVKVRPFYSKRSQQRVRYQLLFFLYNYKKKELGGFRRLPRGGEAGNY